MYSIIYVDFFRSDFSVSCCRWKPDYYRLSTSGGWREKRVLRQFLTMSDIYSLSVLFSLKVKIFCWSTQFDSNKNLSKLGGWLGLAVYLIFLSRNGLGSKFNYARIEGGGVKRLKWQVNSYHLSKLSQYFKMWHVNSVGDVDALFRNFDFSNLMLLLTTPEMWFLYFEFFPTH